MNKKRSVILIGMPGSGKSSVGVLLAKACCMQFLDTDMMIQRREKMPLQRIIRERGAAVFSSCEEAAVLSIRQRGQVIATGGSVVLSQEAMRHLKSLGTIVYLDVSANILTRRLWNLKTRGIVMKPGQTIEDLSNERRPLYEAYADIVVRPGRTRIEEVVQMIADQAGLTRCDV
jgi:shikimate kinase